MLIALALALYAMLGYGAYFLGWDEPTFITAAFGGVALVLAVGFLTRVRA